VTPDLAERATYERRALHDLKQDPDNPKSHPDRNLRAIRASLAAHGQVAPLVVQASTGVIIAGNATALCMAALGMVEADVAVVDCDDEERRRLAVRLNRTSELGEWNTDNLRAALDGWGEDGFDAELWSADEAAALFEGTGGPGSGSGSGEDPYSRKVKAPVYEPKGECPEPSDLFDITKSAELRADIVEADLPPDLTTFLLEAADRHTRFHFRRIAEFYCHAEPEVQRLMEASGLVIIDFDAAIEAGFVKLSSRLGALADDEVSRA
jgi:hypothetical protein